MSSYSRLALVLVVLAACSHSVSEETPRVEALICPELAGEADLLELSFSSDPDADQRIRTFLASVRGLYDVTVEMERLGLDACRRMATDLGARVPKEAASLQEACAPVLRTINHLTQSGVELQVAIAEPRCSEDGARGGQCRALCAGESVECQALCRAQAAIYAQCSLPSVSVAVSSNVQAAVDLAATLERNLPALLYAQLALGRRLVDHAEGVVRISTKLSSDLKSAEPRGIACVTLAATTTGKTATHLQALLSASSELGASWHTATAPPAPARLQP